MLSVFDRYKEITGIDIEVFLGDFVDFTIILVREY